MFALVHEAEGFQFLIDEHDLWRPPRVVVRRGYIQTTVWLDEDDISFLKASRFSVRDQERILALVRENFDDLICWWCELKNDVRRGRFERNILID